MRTQAPLNLFETPDLHICGSRRLAHTANELRLPQLAARLTTSACNAVSVR